MVTFSLEQQYLLATSNYTLKFITCFYRVVCILPSVPISNTHLCSLFSKFLHILVFFLCLFGFKMLLTFCINSLHLHKETYKLYICPRYKFWNYLVPNPLRINIALIKRVEQVLLPFSPYSFEKKELKVFRIVLTMVSLMMSGYSYAFNNCLHLHR